MTISITIQQAKEHDALLISLWIYLTDLNSQHNQTIFSIRPSPSNSYSLSSLYSLFVHNSDPTVFNEIVLKIDHIINHRIKLYLNDTSMPIRSNTGLSQHKWHHISFIITCNPLTILIKLNDEYFEKSFSQNTIMYDLDLSHYTVSLSSSSKQDPGFRGLIGPLFHSTFALKNKSQFLKQTDFKEKYQDIIDHLEIQKMIEIHHHSSTNSVSIVQSPGTHNELSTKQHSLITINQLLGHQCCDKVNVSRVALQFCKWENLFVDECIAKYKSGALQPLSPPHRNLISVCHDMAGGYHHDADAFGHHFYDTSSTENVRKRQLPFEYVMEYWPMIDVFIYFSHDFITIPPVQWIENAHRFNTLILGTLITEHEYGTKITHQMIDNAKTRQRIVAKMVELAVFYKFDGWFLNFESSLKANHPASITHLILFVRELTIALHAAIPYGKVIWYDSVSSETGRVQWQSRLNLVNLPFFNECDGLFTDYHWQKLHPLDSIRFAAKSQREYAVFTGIDIWGRGTYGDGGWNTGTICDFLLNQTLVDYTPRNTSIGLFATAWTFEHEISVDHDCRPCLDADFCSDYHVDRFRMNEDKMWRGTHFMEFVCNDKSCWNVSAFGKEGWNINEEEGYWTASYKWCARQCKIQLNQSFDMKQIQNNNNSNCNGRNYTILVKQSVAGTGPKFEDLYHLLIEFRNLKNEVIHRVDRGQITVTEEWTDIVVEYKVTDSHPISEVVITERAKDVEYWAGHFGTKVKAPVIMILYGNGGDNKKGNGNSSGRDGRVSIVDAVKRRNGINGRNEMNKGNGSGVDCNHSHFGCDTFFDLKSIDIDGEDKKTGDDGNSSDKSRDDDVPGTWFWCNTFNVGYGKQWVNPGLDEIGVLGKCKVVDHCWSDLSMQHWNTNLRLKPFNVTNDLVEDEAMMDVEDEELRKALAMSMMDNDDNDNNQDIIINEESSNVIYSEDGWLVSSNFDDAFYGGHCLQFESSNDTVTKTKMEKDNNVFIYLLHNIAQDQYVHSGSVVSCCFAVKSIKSSIAKNEKHSLYLVMDLVDGDNVSHRVQCRDKMNHQHDGILVIRGHAQKQYGNGWTLHVFDFKAKGDGLKFKFIGLNACIASQGVHVVRDKSQIMLGYVSISISPIAIRKEERNEVMVEDEKETDSEEMKITRTVTVNANGDLDNIVKMDWSNTRLKGFEGNDGYSTVNVYVVESARKIDDAVTGKWINSMQIKQVILGEMIQNMEWLVALRFMKKQVMFHTSVIARILDKWKKKKKKEEKDQEVKRSVERFLLIGVDDLRFSLSHSSMWSIVKLNALCV